MMHGPLYIRSELFYINSFRCFYCNWNTNTIHCSLSTNKTHCTHENT